MTVVIGTAGHIDHGKTALLRALTGMDADRLPEERRRGMTIDVGYAWMRLPDGQVLDFVDVPGHDRLVGNMLVGAGEVDAALLVVAADDGPRPQTLEHLELLDALGVRQGVVAITKSDLVAEERLDEVWAAVAALIAATSLAGSRVLGVSSVTGAGLDDLSTALAELTLAAAAGGAGRPGPARLAIDRSFSVRGRGLVVTGTLRGGPLRAGDELRLEPDGGPARGRELQVHGARVEVAGPGGRLALNLAGLDRARPVRGSVLARDPAVVSSRRLLVALRPALDLAAAAGHGASGPHAQDPARSALEEVWPRPGAPARRAHLGPGAPVRLHLGTAAVEGVIRRGRRDVDDLPSGERTAILRLAEPIAVAPGDRFVLRRPSPPGPLAGGRVLDAMPPTGAPWRHAGPDAVAALALAGDEGGRAGARLRLHGALDRSDPAVAHLPAGAAVPAGRVVLAADVAAAVLESAIAQVRAAPSGVALPELRSGLARAIQRRAALGREGAADAASSLIEAAIRGGAVERTGDLVHARGRRPGLPAETTAAMASLERLLDVATPPALPDAARVAACPPEGVRALASAGRIVVVGDGIAWSARAFAALEETALRLASDGPLTPARLRDATGTSRKYVMALLEELDRRAVLRRTPDGHVPGPRAAAADRP